MVSKLLIVIFWFAFGLFYFTSFSAQQDTLFYKIKFTDKSLTSYSISNPQAFLSQRSIDRRQKYGIAIVDQDLPVCNVYVDSILTFNSITWKNQSKWFNSLIVTCSDTNDMNIIKNISFVASAIQTKISVNGKQEKWHDLQWQEKEIIHVNNHYPYGLTYNQNHLHKVDYLHDLEFKGQGIHIAIIDSGFEKADELSGFRKLYDENRILSTKDFVAHDGDVYADHYHGTAVLSVIAGEIEGEFFGTAPRASFHLLRSEDVDAEYILEEDYWVSAAEYADSAGVDIINTSLGYSTFDDSTTNHTYADMDGNTTVIALASDIAASKGMLLCTSAGNLGDSNWGYISTPADADSTITVGAVDSLGIRGSFSSFGPSSDGDIKPNVMSVGYYCYLIAPWDGTIIKGNGTSFSSPMMSGMAACLWQALPHLSNMELMTLIEESSHLYTAPDTLNGYGIPNIYAAYQKESGVNYTLSTNLKIHNIYPNPMRNEETLTLMVSSHISQNVQLVFVDALGKQVHQVTMKIDVGKNKVEISNLRNIASGSYRLQFIEEDGDSTYFPLIVF